jgi:hypothetical protein
MATKTPFDLKEVTPAALEVIRKAGRTIARVRADAERYVKRQAPSVVLNGGAYSWDWVLNPGGSVHLEVINMPDDPEAEGFETGMKIQTTREHYSQSIETVKNVHSNPKANAAFLASEDDLSGDQRAAELIAHFEGLMAANLN